MKAPIFRAYIRRWPAGGYIWQARQPFSATTTNNDSPTRAGAIRDIIRDCRHFQDIHEHPDPRRA
jgi:hypothetical protein